MKRGQRKRGGKELTPRRAAPAVEARKKWIWFRTTQDGRSQAREEFDGLDTHGKAGLALRIDRFLGDQSRLKDVDSLGDGLFELRHRVGNNHYRVIFMRWGIHCVALTAFYKNQQRTPKKDLDRARQRARTWVDAHGSKPEE